MMVNTTRQILINNAQQLCEDLTANPQPDQKKVLQYLERLLFSESDAKSDSGTPAPSLLNLLNRAIKRFTSGVSKPLALSQIQDSYALLAKKLMQLPDNYLFVQSELIQHAMSAVEAERHGFSNQTLATIIAAGYLFFMLELYSQCILPRQPIPPNTHHLPIKLIDEFFKPFDLGEEETLSEVVNYPVLSYNASILDKIGKLLTSFDQPITGDLSQLVRSSIARMADLTPEQTAKLAEQQLATRALWLKAIQTYHEKLTQADDDATAIVLTTQLAEQLQRIAQPVYLDAWVLLKRLIAGVPDKSLGERLENLFIQLDPKRIINPGQSLQRLYQELKSLTKFELGLKLVESARMRQLPITKACLVAGAPINTRGSDGDTALMAAVKNQNLPAVKLLLAHKPDLELGDKNGVTPLMVAARGDYPEIARALILAGARLDCRHNSGGNLLTYAAVGNARDALMEVIAAGAPITQDNTWENDPVYRLITHVWDEEQALIVLLTALNKARITDQHGRSVLGQLLASNSCLNHKRLGVLLHAYQRHAVSYNGEERQGLRKVVSGWDTPKDAFESLTERYEAYGAAFEYVQKALAEKRAFYRQWRKNAPVDAAEFKVTTPRLKLKA